MKISDIKIFTLDAFRTNWAFIKVETDEGLYGWGEATLGTQEMSLEGCVADYKRLISSRYKGGDYYAFLRRIGYAEERQYISKLKRFR